MPTETISVCLMDSEPVLDLSNTDPRPEYTTERRANVFEQSSHQRPYETELTGSVSHVCNRAIAVERDASVESRIVVYRAVASPVVHDVDAVTV